MKVKTANIMCIVGLLIQIVGVAFLFMLLCLGNLSNAYSFSEGTVSDAVASCMLVLLIVLFIIIAMISQLVTVLVGAPAIFSGKRKLSVTTGTVFVCIFCGVSILLYFYLSITLVSAEGEASSIVWLAVAFIFNMLSCLYTAVAFIISAITKNKLISQRRAEDKSIAQNEDGGANNSAESGSDSQAEDASYTISGEGK